MELRNKELITPPSTMWACFSNHNCWFSLCSSLSTHSSTAFWLLGLAQMHILENRVQSSLSPHASHPHMPSPPLWLQNLAHAPILLAVITNSGPHSVSWGSCHAVLSELVSSPPFVDFLPNLSCTRTSLLLVLVSFSQSLVSPICLYFIISDSLTGH